MGEKAQDAGPAIFIDAPEDRRQPTLRQHPLQGPILQHPLLIADQIGDALDEAVDRLGLGDAILLAGEPLVEQHLSPGDRQGHQRHQNLTDGADHPLPQGSDRLPIALAIELQVGIPPAQSPGQGHQPQHQPQNRQQPRRGFFIEPGAHQPPELGQQLRQRQRQQQPAGNQGQGRPVTHQTHQGGGARQQQPQRSRALEAAQQMAGPKRRQCHGAAAGH